MNMLVLGGRGMAGHMLVSYFRRTARHKVAATVRSLRTSALRTPDRDAPPGSGGAAGVREIPLDVRRPECVARVLLEERPDVVINAVGVLNQKAEEHPLDAYLVNGFLPHWLAHLCDRLGARLIHISSDCVFSGARGGYREDDPPDGETVYARSKAMGELRHHPRHLTIRTSIIGPEIRPDGIGLMRWFLTSRGTVTGYVRVPWNGVTTLELAKAIDWAIRHPEVAGLVHLTAPEPITKHDLLLLMRDVFGKRDVTVTPVEEPVIDRTLAVTRDDFAYRPPDYPSMLRELKEWMGKWAAAEGF